MKSKEQIKEILERNIGITETKERVNLKAIAELNDDLMDLLWDKDC